MFRIENHIEILLLNHDCVIIPGFGGFVTHHVPAHFDCADGMMLPPCFIVGFNPQLTLNDSLLIQSYADAYELSYPEASIMVEEDVAKIREYIGNNGKWNIHSIGELQIGQNGHYQFEPCPSGIVRPEFYALTGIETGIQTELTPTTAEQSHKILEETDDSNSFIKISHSALRKAAVACVIIAIVVASAFNHDVISDKLQQCGISLNAIEQLLNSNSKTPTSVSTPVKAQTASVQTSTIEEPASDINVETTPQDVLTEEEEMTIDRPFTVVLASQVSLENAEEFIQKMKQKGYDDIRLIGNSLKSRKIVYGSYSTLEEANETKRSFNKVPEFASAWVTEIK